MSPGQTSVVLEANRLKLVPITQQEVITFHAFKGQEAK